MPRRCCRAHIMVCWARPFSNNPNLLLLYKGRHTTRRAHHKRVPESAPGELTFVDVISTRNTVHRHRHAASHMHPCRGRHTPTCTRANLAPSCARPTQAPAHAHSHNVIPALRDEVRSLGGAQGCTHTHTYRPRVQP